MPCSMAMAAPPSTLPSTIAQRGIGRHEHALQKSFAAVFDDRDRGEDRGEQQDHHQRAGKEMGVVELVLRCRPGAEQQPENDRLAQRAEHAVPLAEEPHQLALGQRADDRPGGNGSARVAN